MNTKYQHTFDSHSKLHCYELTISCDGYWIATVDIVTVVMTMFIYTIPSYRFWSVLQ